MKQINYANKKSFLKQETGLLLFYKFSGKWAIHSFLGIQINERGKMFIWHLRVRICINLAL